MNWRKSVCMVSAPSRPWRKNNSRHAEVLQRTSQRAGDLVEVRAEARLAADFRVDRVGGHFPLLFRSNGLLLEKRSKEVVRVLNRAERQDVGRIDLVEDTDLAVETGIVRERILFEVVHAGFKRRSIASDRSDSG